MAVQLPGDLEALVPTAAQEKALLCQRQSGRKPTAGKLRGAALVETMPSSRHLLMTLLVCFLVSCGLVAALAPRSWQPEAKIQDQSVESQTPEPEEVSRFSRLLDAVSANSLHDVLHHYLPEQYKHGVFESDQAALEAIHRENAALAVTMAHMAKRDNSTTTPPTSTPPTNPPPASSSTPPTSPPTSSSPPPPPTSSSPVPSSSTSATNPPTSSAPSSSTRPSPTEPTTSSSRSLRPVTSTYTSNVNGVPVVVTSTAYVGDDVHDAATTTRLPGSLHTDAAAPNHRDVVFAVMGAAAAGLMLA